MGLFTRDPDRPPKPESAQAIERIKQKAIRLANLKFYLETTIDDWNKRMRASVPESLESSLDVRLPLENGDYVRWRRKDGVTLGSYAPQESDRQDVIHMLPDLEAAIEARLDELIEQLEAGGRLSLATPDDAGAISTADAAGAVSIG